MIELPILVSLMEQTYLRILVRSKSYKSFEKSEGLLGVSKDTLDGEILLTTTDVVRDVLNLYAGFIGETSDRLHVQDFEDDGSCVAWKGSSLNKLKKLVEGAEYTEEVLEVFPPFDIKIITIHL